MTGIGNIAGPLLSSVLYQHFGFAMAFGVIGLTIVASSLFFLCYFPKVSSISADETDEFAPADKDGEHLAITPRLFELDGDAPVTTCKLLKEPRVTMAAIGASLCYFQYSFVEPILSPRLVEFGLTPMQIGWFFVIQPVTYIISAVGVLYVPEAIEKRVVIIVGAWAAALSFLFVGPSALMGFPDSVVYCGIGMALVGLFNPVGIVMGLPEMEEASLA